ncbi:MAG: hypothetical protein PHX51_08640 [Clostridia bacterium]|nr:hypothetical protein [Clostridia bacterium]
MKNSTIIVKGIRALEVYHALGHIHSYGEIGRFVSTLVGKKRRTIIRAINDKIRRLERKERSTKRAVSLDAKSIEESFLTTNKLLEEIASQNTVSEVLKRDERI